jgi:hypothetical protein
MPVWACEVQETACLPSIGLDYSAQEALMAQRATLNPWKEKGVPLEKQYKSWYAGLLDPYAKHDVDAYTRCRIILMNGLENEVILFSHNFARACGDPAVRSLLAQTRMVEHQQQTAINWLNPADQSILETTIAFEQVAVDLTAYLARHEPDPYMREVLNFGLLEDFDHLYRYSELLDLLEGKDANSILQGKTEILPARPTADHHNMPMLRLRKHYEKNRVHPLSMLHVLTLMAAEQETLNYYKEHGWQYSDQLARALYAEIATVEEEHVTQYESLLDPTESYLCRQVAHELMEVYNYFHCYQNETDPRIKRLWDEFLHMEFTHLQLWGDMLRRAEGIEPEVLFGEELAVEFKFQENKEYVRRVIDQQRDLRLLPDGGWTTKDQLPADWPSFAFLKTVNADGIPSEQIVESQQARGDRDSRPGNDLLQRARQVAEQLEPIGGRKGGR